MKFITLDNLNENLKSFYKNIIKPEIIKNSSENSVTVIQDNKIVGGKKQKFSYEGFAEKLMLTIGPEKPLAKDLAVVSTESNTYIQMMVSEDGQTLKMNYIMVAPKNTVTDEIDSFLDTKIKRIQWHKEYYDKTEQAQGMPYGNFLNCQECSVTTKENFVYLKSKIENYIGTNIAAILSPENKYYNSNFEEVQVNDDDYIMIIMEGYYFVTTKEVAVSIDEIREEETSSFAFYSQDRTAKEIRFYFKENIISEEVEINNTITESSTPEEVEQLIQSELSKAHFFSEFTNVEQLPPADDIYNNSPNEYYAIVNGKIYSLGQSGWTNLPYFYGQVPMTIKLISPLPETVTIPAAPVIDVEEPTFLDGSFYVGNNFDVYGASGDSFIMTFLVKSTGENSLQTTFSMEQCAQEKFVRNIKSALRTIISENYNVYKISSSAEAEQILDATDFSGLKDKNNSVTVTKKGATESVCRVSRIL